MAFNSGKKTGHGVVLACFLSKSEAEVEYYTGQNGTCAFEMIGKYYFELLSS